MEKRKISANIHFEPKQIIIEGTVTVTDLETNEVISEYEETFAYKKNEFGKLMELLP